MIWRATVTVNMLQDDWDEVFEAATLKRLFRMVRKRVEEDRDIQSIVVVVSIPDTFTKK